MHRRASSCSAEPRGAAPLYCGHPPRALARTCWFVVAIVVVVFVIILFILLLLAVTLALAIQRSILEESVSSTDTAPSEPGGKGRKHFVSDSVGDRPGATTTTTTTSSNGSDIQDGVQRRNGPRLTTALAERSVGEGSNLQNASPRGPRCPRCPCSATAAINIQRLRHASGEGQGGIGSKVGGGSSSHRRRRSSSSSRRWTRRGKAAGKNAHTIDDDISRCGRRETRPATPVVRDPREEARCRQALLRLLLCLLLTVGGAMATAGSELPARADRQEGRRQGQAPTQGADALLRGGNHGNRGRSCGRRRRWVAAGKVASGLKRRRYHGCGKVAARLATSGHSSGVPGLEHIDQPFQQLSRMSGRRADSLLLLLLLLLLRPLGSAKGGELCHQLPGSHEGRSAAPFSFAGSSEAAAIAEDQATDDPAEHRGRRRAG